MPGFGKVIFKAFYPGVFVNNELKTQYMVKSGNYDENLVNVNDIWDIIRPFLKFVQDNKKG